MTGISLGGGSNSTAASDSLNAAKTGFGELNVAKNTAFIQSAPVYNPIPANFSWRHLTYLPVVLNR